jgi:hypothetical protein
MSLHKLTTTLRTWTAATLMAEHNSFETLGLRLYLSYTAMHTMTRLLMFKRSRPQRFLSARDRYQRQELWRVVRQEGLGGPEDKAWSCHKLLQITNPARLGRGSLGKSTLTSKWRRSQRRLLKMRWLPRDPGSIIRQRDRSAKLNKLSKDNYSKILLRSLHSWSIHFIPTLDLSWPTLLFHLLNFLWQMSTSSKKR